MSQPKLDHKSVCKYVVLQSRIAFNLMGITVSRGSVEDGAIDVGGYINSSYLYCIQPC